MIITNKFIIAVILFLLHPIFSVALANTQAPSSELVFLTWPEYIDPEVVKEFEASHNVKIRFVYYQSDDYRDQLVLDAGGKGYDLAIVDGLKIRTYKRYGWLAPVNLENVPHLQHVDKKWRSHFEDAENYSSPFLWGTAGIAYRSDLVPEPLTTWLQLYQPHDALRGKVVMIDSHREVIGLALKSLGYSLNSHNLSEIKEAEALLHKQASNIQGYSYINITENSSLVTGETYAAFAYNGDALSIMEYEPNIKFVLPDEGGIIWVDYLVVFRDAKNQAMAYKFLNFLQQPEIAARVALYTNFASPNISAQALLPQEFLSNPAIYPDPTALAKSETDEELPIRIAKEYARIMVDITHK